MISLTLMSSPGPGIKPIGINVPLVDAEGYPRADIDLYHATNLRKRLGILQIDHKTIMGRIERGLVSFGRGTSSNNVSIHRDGDMHSRSPTPHLLFIFTPVYPLMISTIGQNENVCHYQRNFPRVSCREGGSEAGRCNPPRWFLRLR